MISPFSAGPLLAEIGLARDAPNLIRIKPA